MRPRRIGWGPPHVPLQTSILNLRFKAVTFRVSSGASAWDVHTETTVVGDQCDVIGPKSIWPERTPQGKLRTEHHQEEQQNDDGANLAPT